MENLSALLIPTVLAAFFVRVFILPIRLGLRLAVRAAGGFLCLWMLNALSGYTGITLPITPAAVLIAGFLGIPGIGLLTLLQVCI